MALNDDLRYFNFAAIAFELTNKCPVYCRSCLRNCSPQKNSIMTFDQVVSVLDNLGTRGSFREIGFSGGEAFLYPELLLDICKYIHRHLGMKISAATNAFWAETPSITRKVLGPLLECGLGALLISVDDFHLEYIAPSLIRNCVNTATSMGIKCTLQVITTKTSRKAADLQELLNLPPDGTYIEWLENPCDPIGRAAVKVPVEEFNRKVITEGSLCSVFRLLSVRLDGTALPCCGSGSEAVGLSIGNVFLQDIEEIISDANRSPILNSLAVYGGPFELLEILSKIGYPEYLHKQYSSACDACYQIFKRPEVTQSLKQALADSWPYFFATRIAFQYNLINTLRQAKADAVIAK